MNTKINTICFILLLFLLIGVASATESDNETLQQTIEQSDEDICQMSGETEDLMKTSIENDEKLEMTIENTDKLEMSTAGLKLESKKTSQKPKINSVVSVTQKTILKGQNVNMHYKDGSKFTVTLKDSHKKAIKKAKIQIKINGKTYTKTTDSKGKVTITLNLNVGKYTVVTSFAGSKKYHANTVKNTITVKTTVKSKNVIKYYKNKAAFYSTFYDKKGKLLKNTNVKFKLKDKTYTVKTNKKGVAKLELNLKPGIYSIHSINSKTTENIQNTVTIKSILETKDLTMNESDGSKFTVKVLNSNGKVSPNKKVIMKVNGKSYTVKSNSQGIATQVMDLPAGTHTITTEYEGLSNINKITVIKGITHTPFSHITSIPSYADVTYPYVFKNSAYAIKTGYDGIIRMPKNELFTVKLSEKETYHFSQARIDGIDTTVIGYKTYLIPFDGSGVKSDFYKQNLKGDGILISSDSNYTHIEYRSTGEFNTDLFGVYINKDIGYSETIAYLQNNKVKAMVNFHTNNFDEFGLKYNLGKYHGKTAYDFDYKSYEDIIGDSVKNIKFVESGEPVSFSYFGRSIVGYESNETIKTRFIVNGKEELEKNEKISYGYNKKYRETIGFEVIQSYAIINEKIDQKIVDYWLAKSYAYSKFGIQNIYGMFLASLNTAMLADSFADIYSKEYNVNWKRDRTATILSGINLDKTYIHILNADMGMTVTGSDKNNIISFKLMNSFGLPELENIALIPLNELFSDNITYALGDLFNYHNSYSMIISDDLAMIQMENSNTSIIINQTSGVVNVIMNEEGFSYKGAVVNTANDCCSCNQIGNDIVNFMNNKYFKLFAANPLVENFLKDHGYELGLLGHKALSFALGKLGIATKGLKGLSYSVLGTIFILQDIGTTYRSQQDKKDWHEIMTTCEFTRPGPLQQKKVYNIPNKKGKYDYIEVPIKKDFSLDRENAIYISEGNVRTLTKKETYNYFTDDYYSPLTIPPKYWDKSWKNK